MASARVWESGVTPGSASLGSTSPPHPSQQGGQSPHKQQGQLRCPAIVLKDGAELEELIQGLGLGLTWVTQLIPIPQP